MLLTIKNNIKKTANYRCPLLDDKIKPKYNNTHCIIFFVYRDFTSPNPDQMLKVDNQIKYMYIYNNIKIVMATFIFQIMLD